MLRDLAIENYDQAITLNPDDALAYYNRGLAYHKIDKYDLAIQDFDEIIRIDPNSEAARRAHALREQAIR